MAMGTFILGMVLNLIGIHNIDNAFNMALIGEDWALEFFVEGSIMDAKLTYLRGVKMLGFGLACYIGSFLLLLIGELDFKNTFKSTNPKN
jgi:hypothetical protein